MNAPMISLDQLADELSRDFPKTTAYGAPGLEARVGLADFNLPHAHDLARVLDSVRFFRPGPT